MSLGSNGAPPALRLPRLTRSSSLVVVALLALMAAHANAELREFAIPTQNVGADKIATGPDGALWFTEANAGQIGRITASGTITEYSASGVRDPESIVSGPENALWFGQPRAIGKIQANGTTLVHGTNAGRDCRNDNHRSRH
jgi:streptogramin lyase